MRLIFILIYAFSISSVCAQEYRFRLYRVEQGLPNDVVKAVAQDSLGFVWIATDDGLVKYDGQRFTTYKAAFRSQYTKAFLNTRSGRLLAIGDLDLIEIRNQVDTVIFKTVLAGARTFSDSAIWYPKSIYEDRSANIWLGEPQSAIRYDGKSMKRFDFGAENRSPVFIRSFSFFEDDNENLFAVSYRGKVFRLDKRRDEFVALEHELPADCAHVLFDQHKLYVATGTGVYEATIDDGDIRNVRQLLPVKQASYLLTSPDGALWVGTFDDDLYQVNRDSEVTWKALGYSFKGINSIYQSNEGDLWTSTDKGMVLVQSNLFELADPLSQAQFIEGIAEDATLNRIYFCNKETIVQLESSKPDGPLRRTVIYDDRNAYFQSLQVSKRGLWASSIYEVMLFSEGKLFRKWDFSSEGNFVHDIFLDSRQQLWGCQAGNANVIMINDSLRVKRYPIPSNKQNEVTLVREGPNGLYVAASGPDKYLFFKPHTGDSFRDISLPIKFSIAGDFTINDFAVQQNNVVWIASTEGLIRFGHQKIERIDLGETFTAISVSSIEILDERNIIFSNSHGLFRYDLVSNEYWLYDENSGLPSNTITGRGIFIDHKKQLWIGTSYGLARTAQSIIQNKQTTKPHCIEARVNGEGVRFIRGVQASYGAFIHLQFSSITFPENKINLQWKMQGDTLWHAMRNHQLSFTDLWPGEYNVLVRAKKNTGLDWSEPTMVSLLIAKPYWLRIEFIFFLITIILIIAWASYSVTSRLLNKRKVQLERLIEKRTTDVQRANNELMQRNAELDRFVYSASHDLSAPLKSVLGLIAVSRMENPGEQHEQYLTMMEGSVRKLEDFIRDVVSYSRNTRMPVKNEAVDFSELIQSLLNDQQYAPNFSRIDFQVEDTTGSKMVTDVMRLKIVLNNLISNAIKFHWLERENPFVKIKLMRQGNAYSITVQDNGQGIDEAHTAHVFEMFYRASESAQGSGLGLYILKETVLKMSGKVSVKSKIGEGTTFTVMLPVPAQV
ncbi:MAG: GHKL domain-containing protein [Cyclobacteriaceae bacterium]|nr:GHKL domain-containing protein [Cyclobacteriaceae bacterium]